MLILMSLAAPKRYPPSLLKKQIKMQDEFLTRLINEDDDFEDTNNWSDDTGDDDADDSTDDADDDVDTDDVPADDDDASEGESGGGE